MDLVPPLAETAEQIELAWSREFFGLDQDQRFVLLIVSVICVTVIVFATVAMLIRLVNSVHRRRAEAELKQQMIDRGMDAEEVARVIEAAPPHDWLDRWAGSRQKTID